MKNEKESKRSGCQLRQNNAPRALRAAAARLNNQMSSSDQPMVNTINTAVVDEPIIESINTTQLSKELECSVCFQLFSM